MKEGEDERENAPETDQSEGEDNTSGTELPALDRPVIIDADNLSQNVFEGDGSGEETEDDPTNSANQSDKTTTDTVERDNPEMEKIDQLAVSLLALFGGAFTLDEDQRERVLRDPWGLK
jgi:hypothetical protein